MEKEIYSNLEEKLSQAVADSPFLEQHPIEIAISGPNWLKTDSGKQLLALLGSTPAFSNFNNHIQALGNSGRSVELKDLANWLVERSIQTSPVQASKELQHYQNSSEVDVCEIMLLNGASIDSEYEFSNGLSIIKPENIPNRKLLNSILNSNYSLIPTPRVDSVIIAHFKQSTSTYPNTDFESEHQPKPNDPLESLLKTKRCISISRSTPHGIHCIASATLAPDNIPIINSISGWSILPNCEPGPTPPIIGSELRRADELILKIPAMSDSGATRLATPIDRLNNFNSSEPFVDRLVDLRTCIESLFLDKGNKEQLRFTLSLRAALYAGKSVSEKKEIRKLFKEVYDMSSAAVHEGTLSKKTDFRKAERAAQHAKTSIHKIIENGWPDWEAIEMGEIPIEN